MTSSSVRSRTPAVTVRATHREHGPYFPDGARGGGAVDIEPAGQRVMGGAMAQMDEGSQQTLDHDQLVLRTGPTARGQGRECGLVPLMPQWTDLGDEFSDHIGRRSRDPLAPDDRRTWHVARVIRLPAVVALDHTDQPVYR